MAASVLELVAYWSTAWLSSVAFVSVAPVSWPSLSLVPAFSAWRAVAGIQDIPTIQSKNLTDHHCNSPFTNHTKLTTK